jgi:hypothetical protein
VEAWEKVGLRMVGWSCMPARGAPLTVAGEGVMLGKLVEDLRMNFGTRVSENLSVDREAIVSTKAS